jgi:hypothetical protein
MPRLQSYRPMKLGYNECTFGIGTATKRSSINIGISISNRENLLNKLF